MKYARQFLFYLSLGGVKCKTMAWCNLTHGNQTLKKPLITRVPIKERLLKTKEKGSPKCTGGLKTNRNPESTLR